MDAPDTMVPIVHRPEDISVIVVGGAGKHSSWQPTFGDGTHFTRREITLPKHLPRLNARLAGDASTSPVQGSRGRGGNASAR